MNGLLDRLRTALASLAPRERLLLAGAGGVLLLTILWLASRCRRSRACARRGTRRCRRARSRLGAPATSQARRTPGPPRRRRAAHPRGTGGEHLHHARGSRPAVGREGRVDGAAGRAGAGSATRRPRSRSCLKQVTLAQAVAFLHGVDSSPQLLSVKSLRIRTRAEQKEEMLDVTFTVSSFEAR